MIGKLRSEAAPQVMIAWWEVNILSKFQVPSSNGLGVKVF